MKTSLIGYAEFGGILNCLYQFNNIYSLKKILYFEGFLKSHWALQEMIAWIRWNSMLREDFSITVFIHCVTDTHNISVYTT